MKEGAEKCNCGTCSTTCCQRLEEEDKTMGHTMMLFCFLAYMLYTMDCRFTTSNSCLASCNNSDSFCASVSPLCALKPSIALRRTYLHPTGGSHLLQSCSSITFCSGQSQSAHIRHFPANSRQLMVLRATSGTLSAHRTSRGLTL